MRNFSAFYLRVRYNVHIFVHPKNGKNMRTTNATDLRNNLKKYLDAVINDSDTVIINRDGGTGAVLISLDEYNAIKETEYIMSSSAMMKAIKDGEQEIADGKGLHIRSIKDLEEFANNL